MNYHLNIDWHTATGTPAPASVNNLKAVLQSKAHGVSLEAEVVGQRLRFAHLKPGFYTLALSYNFEGHDFDSFYFGLDVPDITSMKIALTSKGSLIEQMGSLNDYGEFMDTRLEEDPVYLTHLCSAYPVYQQLAKALQAADIKTPQINAAIGDLSKAFPQIQSLWAHQLRRLLDQQLLNQMTPQALACIQHLLTNHLELMDDESLHENLHIAIEKQGAEETIARLLTGLEWNSTQNQWDGMNVFLEQIAGHPLIKIVQK